MNLRNLDLNLLVILDALLDETHVSRAALRLGLTQPAVSAALQRCRGLFGDDLLVRGRGAMRMTPRAQALRAPLKLVLADVLALVDPPEIPLAQIRQMIRIVLADQVASLLLPPLLQTLAQNAPGLDIVMRPWLGASAARQALLAGEADLALSVFDRDVEGLERRLVLKEHYVVAMRRDHPAARNFDLQHWLQWPHILVSGTGDRHSPLDDHLAKRGLARRVGLVVPSFQLVPDLLVSTDLIAMMPAHSIPADLAGGLALHAPPIAVDGFPMHLAWLTRRKDDKALGYVTDCLANALSETIVAISIDCPAQAHD